jgi:hypothetical protein
LRALNDYRISLHPGIILLSPSFSEPSLKLSLIFEYHGLVFFPSHFFEPLIFTTTTLLFILNFIIFFVSFIVFGQGIL